MQISRVFKRAGTAVTSHPPTELTLDGVRQQHEVNVRFYLELIEVVGKTDPAVLDLSLLLLETFAGQSLTWAALLSSLTPALIDSYTTTLTDPEILPGGLRPILVSNVPYLSMSYLNIKTPEDRNIPQFKWRMPDLGIRQVDTRTRLNPPFPLDFQHCLCSVNGLISRPTVFDGELIIPDGAKFLASCHAHRWPDVVLMDFSVLGGIELIPFSRCKRHYKTAQGLTDPLADLELELPTGTTLVDKTVFMVLDHTLYFPKELQVVSDRSVVITPQQYPLGCSQLRRVEASHQQIRYTDICAAPSVADYLLVEMFKTEHRGAFLVLVKHPKLTIRRTPCLVDHQGHNLVIRQDPDLLIQQSTRAIVGYCMKEYNTENYLYLNQPPSLYRLDRDWSMSELGMGSFDCVHQDLLTNYNQSAYDMVRIAKG